MPYTFNPFTGNFDNTPSTTKGDEAYSTLQSASADWATYEYVGSTFLPLTGGALSGNLSVGFGNATFYVETSAVGINTENPNKALTVVGDISATGTIYGLSVDTSNLNSVYNTVQANSATNWDNALANQYAHANFLPLSGGVITGPTRFNNNVTIFGNLSCSGTQTFANTVFTTTSAISVVHFGSGPAMWIGNNGNGDIASFYDIDQGVEVLHVGGINGDFPNVGVKTSTPNKDFTVNGEISASNTIWAKESNSDQWTSVYNTVLANSAVNWNYQGTDLKALSANWQNTYTTVQSNSSKWESVYSTVQSNSATNWNYQGTDLKALSGNWQSAYNSLCSLSSSWATYSFIGASYLPLSGGTLTGALEISGTQTQAVLCALTTGRVGINTESPNEALTVVGNISASGNILTRGQFLSGGVDIATLFGGGGAGVDTAVRALTGNWQSTYLTVSALSATWGSGGSNVSGLSANWQNTYTTVQSNSSKWESVYSTVQSNSATNWNLGNYLPLSGGTVTGTLAVTGTTNLSGNLIVQQNRSVGIGTNTPNQTLTVVGNISSTGFVYKTNPIFFVNTTPYTLTEAVKNSLIVINNSVSSVVVVPNDTSVSFMTGAEVNITGIGTGIVYISGGPGVAVLAPENRNRLRTQNSTATIVKLSANNWLLFGDIWL